MQRYLRALNIKAEIATANFDAIELLPLKEDTSSKELVSIIITVYNAQEYIETTLISLCNQSHQNLEMIVVDDHSTDSSFNLLKRWAAQDARIKVLQTAQNSGTYLAKNLGIRAARGEFIALCDSDDLWTPDHAARHLKLMRSRPNAMVSTSQWIRLHQDCALDVSYEGVIKDICPHSTFFRRCVFEEIGYFDGVRFGADREFINRIALRYGKQAVVALPNLLTLGRRHSASLTTGGAGGFSAKLESRPRVHYWEAWNEWHFATARNGGSLFYSGNPTERPFSVLPMMEPSYKQTE